MIIEEIRADFLQRQDIAYRDFQCGLLPTVPPETMLGVRTPGLRALAKKYAKHPEVNDFLSALPHALFEENQLHAFLISETKDPALCFARVNAFLPFVDNWATCDQLNPRVFRKHKAALLEETERWLQADHPYTVRFAIRMLMTHFLDDAFDPRYPAMAAAVQSEEYYIKMMVAWYFATALAKQPAAALPFIEQRRLDPRTHNMAIQKAVESRRITEEQKRYLKTLKVKNPAKTEGEGG